jgi:signal transduction histidine kinase
MKNYFVLIITLMFMIAISKAEVPLFSDVASNRFANDDSTRQLIALVKDASALIQKKGEAAFDEFRVRESRWREGERYIFVLDPDGNMIVHPDPQLEGKSQIGLKDINGKPIIQGLIHAATASADKPEGWYHYEWPVPGGLLPRWKSSFVQLAIAPSGKQYIVGCGNYNDRMEREFVVDIVKAAVLQIQEKGRNAFPQFYDPAGPFRVKDAYIFVFDPNGIDLVNPGFPNLEGRNLMDIKDARDKYLVKDMFDLVQDFGGGWTDYMWPKPGESVPTVKSTYVRKAMIGDDWVLVGCGVYLADAPKLVAHEHKMTAPELISLVREAAAVFETRGEQVFPEFRTKGTKWFEGDTYFFVWTMDGKRLFNAATPELEGLIVSDLKDIHGRPVGRMILEAGATPEGEGWVHYLNPEPDNIFPIWKSTFVKRVTFPSGQDYIIGCGIYNMQMDGAFIVDVVDRAADLIAAEGPAAFDMLRDKTGPFLFMDTYVFVDNLTGVELVNAAQPSLEGKNMINEQDVHGKYVMREYLDAAVKNGSAWVDYYWYRPGDNAIAKKHTYVKLVQYGKETFVVGAGYYDPESERVPK